MAIASFGVSLACARERPAVEPGVPAALAKHRRANISDLRYGLRLSVPHRRDEAVTGNVTVEFTLRDPSAPLVLDFTPGADHLHAVRANGNDAQFEAADGHIVIPPAALAAGSNTVELEFTAGDDALNRSDDFLYALFVPDRASHAFPSFDQPNLKARVSLSLELPADWVAVANGAPQFSIAPAVGESASPGNAASAPSGRRTVSFAETPPISTYLISFAAGTFQVDTATLDGRTMHMYHRETDRAKVARNRAAIFELHARALSWLETYTGIPYPFDKFDFVLLPAFQFGGMEHPGAIFYRAQGLMLDESATQNQLLGRASVIAHETAHMWFGDLVTMDWFNDVWMKEVFANFMAAKIVNPSFPEVNHDLRFFLAHHPAAYSVDRTAGANAIRQPLENLKDAGTLYGPIIYQKAPVVMRQLELAVGDTVFRDGLREYLDRFRFANATWSDLVDILDRRSEMDLRAWSRVWVEEPGRPVIRTEVRLDGSGRIERMTVVQRDPAGRGRAWSQQFGVMVGWEDSSVVLPVEMAGTTTAIPRARGLAAPRFVLPNADGRGYGRFVLDSATLAFLRERLPRLTDPLARGVAWVTLWDAVLESEFAPADFLDLALRAIPSETDEQNVQRILGYVPDAFWRFLPVRERDVWAERLEQVLWDALERNENPRLKTALFRAYESVALTAPAIDRLSRVWNRTLAVAGLRLAEPDYTRLALDLAVREAPGWARILDEQAGRIENPDRKAQFAFVRPAVSADTAVRDSMFAALRDARNREREPWVLEALGYLNHPLRGSHAERYVRPALELLEEIQRTGDIFFPSGWLDATLSGHNSLRVAQIVRDFLERRPDYPARLRAKILQAADPLFRAAAIAH
ncbi:MAG TPA: M1 family aminopeptidase [Gemmatimonadales bacterium]|nr:M1 family aminopeptidase [Gemmatimonadales bacterium]